MTGIGITFGSGVQGMQHEKYLIFKHLILFGNVFHKKWKLAEICVYSRSKLWVAEGKVAYTMLLILKTGKLTYGQKKGKHAWLKTKKTIL